MFRKPKTKNIRQRIREDGEDRPSYTDTENGVNGRGKSNQVDDDIRPDEITVVSDSRYQSKPKSILSFDQDEGDDVVDFKIKRKTSHKHEEKAVRKHKDLLRKAERYSREKSVELLEDIKPRSSDKSYTKSKLPDQQKSRYKIPEKTEIVERNAVELEDEVRQAFSSSFADIPDAKAVYEARKKREMMRKGGGGGGADIPLDDTVRLKSRTGERSRLVREDDENDLSDEEDTGRFYSSKRLLDEEEEMRREEQANFLRIEQGGSDEEGEEKTSDDEELLRWEREQMQKGVSSIKVVQMQEELNATSLHYRGQPYDPSNPVYGEAAMDIDMDFVEEVEPQQNARPSFVKPDGSLPGEGNASVDALLEKIQSRIVDRRERLNVSEADLQRTQSNIAENTTSIERIESANPQLQQRFQLYQEMRLYARDLLECLNEKIDEINSLEEKVMGMWKKRCERLVKRRRQDVQDQYEKCAAASMNRPWAPTSSEFAQREAEREARRNRRRRERERLQQSTATLHNEGLSSDDEETPSQEMDYRETIGAVQERARAVFFDTADEFCQIGQILDRFIDWLVVDERSFEDAYISLCIPKLISPFIRLNMLDWRPLRSTSPALHSQPWYHQLLSAGLNNSGLDLNNPTLVNLIPLVVEKVLLPKIARIIREQWDPMSLTESANLGTLLRTLIEEYPVANVSSRRMKEVLDELYKKIQDCVQNDTFVPLYSKEAIEATETGCGAFLDRQFWASIKLIRSVMSFRYVFSEACLEELLIEGIVNRSTVLALQVSVISDVSIVGKCMAVISEIPRGWLPPSRPASYRSLATLLGQVLNVHRHRDKEFSRHAQSFVELAQRTVKREEA